MSCSFILILSATRCTAHPQKRHETRLDAISHCLFSAPKLWLFVWLLKSRNNPNTWGIISRIACAFDDCHFHAPLNRVGRLSIAKHSMDLNLFICDCATATSLHVNAVSSFFHICRVELGIGVITCTPKEGEIWFIDLSQACYSRLPLCFQRSWTLTNPALRFAALKPVKTRSLGDTRIF